jgi:hypothetical protein
MIMEFYRQIFGKYSSIKFHENSCSGSRVVRGGRAEEWTDRQTEMVKLIVAFRNFAKALKKCKCKHVSYTKCKCKHVSCTKCKCKHVSYIKCKCKHVSCTKYKYKHVSCTKQRHRSIVALVNIGATYNWVVIVTLRPFLPPWRSPFTRWSRGCVGPRFGLNMLRDENMSRPEICPPRRGTKRFLIKTNLRYVKKI